MASKTISLTTEVYELLSRFKLPNESFGDAIKRLCEERSAKSIYEWITSRELWTDMTEEELNEINENLKASRLNFTVRKVGLNDNG